MRASERARERMRWFAALALLGGCYASESSLPQDEPEEPARAATPEPERDPERMASAQAPTASKPEARPPSLMLPLELGEERVLNDPLESQGGPPTSRWMGDHWLVAWSAVPALDSTATPAAWIELARLDDEGAVIEQWQRPTVGPAFGLTTALNDEGELGVVHDRSGCTLELLDVEPTKSAPQQVSVSCGFDQVFAAAPLPRSDDWLVAYGDNAGDAPLHYMVGRYRSALDEWVFGPTLVAPRERIDQTVGVFAVGDDALLAWGDMSGSTIATVPGMAGDDVRAVGLAEVTRVDFDATTIGSDTSFGLAHPGEHSLLFGMDGRNLWSARVRADDPPVVAPVAPSGVGDVKPGVAYAPELGLTGVCYSTGPGPASGAGHDDGVSFVLVDAHGTAVGEPIVLESAIYNTHGCAVSWSGNAFLLVWWAIDLVPVDHGSWISARVLRPHQRPLDLH